MTEPARKLAVVQPTAAPKERHQGGWRKSKPVEDPEKTKTWGFITAKPSEFLIHVRRGRVLERTTGQGASCFKWPWDSVAIVPTTINRLQFVADQVTREKVGVEVTGLAVFRIVDPLITYRMLNFSYAERAGEKLEEILGEMFVGATRRLVANLSVEDVLTRRKEALAGELMKEIAPIVEGRGRAEDDTDQGWGVVIDTIEIQDVHVLSAKVFAQMQATFRSELERRSREAALEAAKVVALKEAVDEKEIATVRLESTVATREMRARGEARAAEIELEEASKREAIESRMARARIAREQEEALAEIRSQAELEAERSVVAERRIEAERALQKARAARDQEALDAEIQLEAERTRASVDRAREGLALTEATGKSENVLLREKKEIENLVSEESLRVVMMREALPAIAEAFAKGIGDVRLYSFGEHANPSSLIAGAIGEVLRLADEVKTGRGPR
jgi:hypothetical protein